jgi:choice-of-anchor B domain-containing protein
MKKYFIGAWLLLTLPLISMAQKNTSLVGHLAYPEVELNDVWGYVDAQGREYALVGTREGVSIVSLTDPAQPAELFYLPGIETAWRDLKTHNSFAYVSNEGGDGIRIIDLTYLPDSVSYKDTILNGVKTAHNVYIDEGYLYVPGTNNFNGGFAIFDLNPDPWNPVFRSAYDDFYVHDVYVRNDLAYSAEITKGQLRIIDVSDKSNPQPLGDAQYPDAFTHNTWLNDAGDVCYTTDEYGAGYLMAWDVADPGDIQLLDRIRSSLSDEEAIPHNVHVLNDFLVTSYYRDGLHIVDANRPGNLVEVGYYDSSPLVGDGFNGAWGAYPFLPSGLVLVTDIEEGLFVLDVNYQRACYLEGRITDAETGFPIGQVKIGFSGEVDQERSRTNGNYALGVANAGEYEITFQRFGYEPETLLVNMDNGVLIEEDLVLNPRPRQALTFKVVDALTQEPIEDVRIEAQGPVSEAFFSYQTGANGTDKENFMVLDAYTITVGKWGYISQQFDLEVDANTGEEVLIQLSRGYYDDFVLDFDWTVQSTSIRGQWERGEPIGTYETLFGWGIQNPEFDHPDDLGNYCYVTGNAGGAAFGDDVDWGYTRLLSPPMDLGFYVNPVIQYHWWLVNWSLKNGGQPGNDFLAVSLTDGIDTVLIDQYIGPFDTTWNEASFVVRDSFPDLSRPFQLIFYTQDLERSTLDAVEAGIDFVQVREGELPADEESGVSVFPNPVQDLLHLVLTQAPPDPQQPLEFDLIDLAGRSYDLPTVSQWERGYRFSFPYPHGLYILRISQNGEPIDQVKILK